MFTSRYCNLIQRSTKCRNTAFIHPYAPARAAFSSSAASRHNTSAASTTAQNVQRNPPTSVPKLKGTAATAPKPQPKKELKLEDQLEELDRVHATEQMLPFDVWGQAVETFDLHIPSWRSKRKDASIADHARAFWASQMNAIRNVISLWRMADEQSFPGLRVKSKWSRELFKTQTTPWLKPFLREALDVYKQMYQAIAAGDDKNLKKLTVANYRDHVLKQLRSQNRSHVYIWKFHGENTPCKVVSIRAIEANHSRIPLTFGNRLLVQALVRFDTMQSLEVYSKKGERIAGDGTPKRVVQYLVLQKRMWYDGPWTIRDELFEELESRYTAA